MLYFKVMFLFKKKNTTSRSIYVKHLRFVFELREQHIYIHVPPEVYMYIYVCVYIYIYTPWSTYIREREREMGGGTMNVAINIYQEPPFVAHSKRTLSLPKF